MTTVYKVIATIDHDCYEKGDTITTHSTWAQADKMATSHNSLYLREMGIASEVKTVTE